MRAQRSRAEGKGAEKGSGESRKQEAESRKRNQRSFPSEWE